MTDDFIRASRVGRLCVLLAAMSDLKGAGRWQRWVGVGESGGKAFRCVSSRSILVKREM